MGLNSPITEAEVNELMESNKEFAFAFYCTPTVQVAMRRGLSAADVIIELTKQLQTLYAKYEKLAMIAPRAVKFRGTTYIWRCPDSCVPVEEIATPDDPH